MSIQDFEDATKLLVGWQCRDEEASRQLFQLAYEDIRAVIARLTQKRRPEDTLLQDSSITELANEAVVKLHIWRRDEELIESRKEFLNYVNMSVFHLLFGVPHYDLELTEENVAFLLGQVEEAIPASFLAQHELNRDLYQALTELREKYPRQYNIFEKKNFTNATNDELSEIYSISKRTIIDDLKFARAWLATRLNK